MLRGSLFLLFFFYIFQNGHEKRDCIALIGLVIVGLQRAQQRSLQLLKAYQRRVYLYQQKLQGIGGSMVAFSPATWEIRVQFPANARNSLLLSRMRACTISKNAQTSGAEAIFVGPNPEEIIRFCVVATFVQRLKRQYLFIKWP